MDFVDEDDSAAAEFAEALGIDHDGLDFFDAGEDGAEGQEFALRHAGDDVSERGLADAGRAPENDGSELVAFDLGAQRFAGAENVFLAGVVVERGRPHAIGERTL